jgi:hypothetical protein
VPVLVVPSGAGVGAGVVASCALATEAVMRRIELKIVFEIVRISRNVLSASAGW